MAGAPISQEIKLPTDTSQVGRAVKKLDEMIARVEKLERAGEHHRKVAEAGFRGIGKAIDETKMKIREFGEFVGAVAAFEVLEKIADKFIDIGREAVTAAAKAERMNRVINIAAGGGEAGERTRGWLEKFSKGSEFTEAQNESAYVALKRVGIGQRQAGLMMKAAADVAAVSEDKTSAFQSAIEAFSRIQVMGRVNARALMPLGVGVKDIKALGGQYAHMNVQQLNHVLESGQFDQNQLFKLIMSRAGETKLGSRAADNANLLGTKMEKLSELPELYFKRLGASKDMGGATQALDDILKRLDPESASGQKIMKGLLGAMELTERFLEHLPGLIDKATASVRLFGSAAAVAMGPLAGGLMLGGTAREGDRRAIREGVSASLYGKTPEEMQHLGVWGKLKQSAKGALRAGAGIVTGGHVDLFGDEFHAAGKAVSDGLAKGIESHAARAESAASGMADRVTGAAQKALDVHSPSRVFEHLGRMSVEGYAIGLEDNARRISDAMDSTISIPFESRGWRSVAGRLGGDHYVEVTVGDVIVPGAESPAATAAAVREELARSLTAALTDALRQRDLEG